MSQIVAQVVALNAFARKSDFISESWASTDFRATYQAAVAACKPELDSTYGVNIHWSPSFPEVLTVRRTNLINERTEFSRELPLDGAAGAALVADLKALATKEAVVRIQAERDAALLREAGQRVDALLHDATLALA